MKRIYHILLLAITLTSCFDENSFVIKPIDNAEVRIPYSMYEDQAYFNLYDTLVVSHNNYADWDLGFESTPMGYHIFLNTKQKILSHPVKSSIIFL